MGESAKVFELDPADLKGSKAKKVTDSILKMSLIIFISFMSGLISFLAYDWFIYSHNHMETNNAYIEGDIYQVHSRMMGYVRELKVEEGAKVNEKDILLVLDDTDINVEKRVKEARLKKTQADFNRAKILMKAHLISISDYELLEATLAAASADVEGSDLKQKYTHIITPADGMIAKIFVRPGQFIQPGQNLFTVVSNKRFWIKANYKETQVEKIKIGQKVDVDVDAYPGVKFTGQVVGVYPSSGSTLSLLPPENATGNFTKVVQRVPIKISLDQVEGYEFRPGMSVITSILLDKK